MRAMGLRVMAMLMLAACGPVYTTDYQMVPPTSMEGKMCANNCLMAQQNCAQACASSTSQCEQNERLRAENEYLKYARDRRAEGKEVKRKESSFYAGYQCDGDDCTERCESSYRLCHTNCGGQVIPHTYCSAFCQ